MKEELEKLDKQIAELSAQRSVVRQKIAEEACPFHVGQTIVDKHGVRARVSRIVWAAWHTPYKLFAHKLKKNGDDHIKETRAWDTRDWKPEHIS